MAAAKKIKKEYNKILQEGNKFAIELIENDIKRWKATLVGPENTPYSNGRYIVHIIIPDQYPFSPPSIKFINPPYCVNVVGHNDYDNKNTTDANYEFGYISFDLLQDNWSPALSIQNVLHELYQFCFYECGFHETLKKTKIFWNKYNLYSYKPREFLFTASKYNELYANGDKPVYYILPQINEMEYFQSVSVIDAILRDKYKCSEDIIEQFLLFYGKKVNFCGLCDQFKIPLFNGTEDTDEMQQIKPYSKYKYRPYDEIVTDINKAERRLELIDIFMNAAGNSSKLYCKGHKELTGADLKVLFWEKNGSVKDASRSRLIYAGKQMDETRTLADYNYKSGERIYVALRFHGG